MSHDLSWIDSLPESAKRALLAEAELELSKEKLLDYRPYEKQKLFHELGKTKRERLLRAGNQCISPWTFVETEIGEVQSSELLLSEGVRVRSWVDGRVQNARTSGWFLRGIEPAFRVVLDSGRFFDCSGKHRVLTSEGWISLDRLVSISSGLRYWHKREDYQASCVEDGYLHGQRPPLVLDSGQALLHTQVYVRGHSQSSRRQGEAEQRPECSRAYQQYDRPTTADDEGSRIADLFEQFSGPGVSRPALSLRQNIQEFLRLRPALLDLLQSGREGDLCQETFRLLAGQLERLDAEDSFEPWWSERLSAEPFLCAQHRHCSTEKALLDEHRVAIFYSLDGPELVGGESILAVVPIGYQPIIDCQVPDSHNYIAGGVAHHNCGKTYSAGSEVAYHLTGEYPDWWEGRRWDRPILAWASGETGEATRDNPQRALLGFVGSEGTGSIPHRCLGLNQGNYGMASGVANLYDFIRVRHVSGGWSLLKFKYYAQGRRKWQGPPVDVVWYDEEPPEDIYDEGLARTIATGGMALMSFTPLMGMSSVVRRFLMNPTPDRANVNMTIHDAEHISPEERERIILSFPAHERDARAKGIPTLGSGRIFPVDEELIKVPAFAIPAHWPLIGALDFGWDHPTAAVKLAWDRDADCVYVTNAYRASQQTPIIHAGALKPWGERLPWAWPHDGLQHDKGSGVQLAEQYRSHGLNMRHENAKYPEQEEDTKTSRVSVEAGLSDMLERMQTGRLKIFDHLDDWFEELRLYHRKDGKVVKLVDDLMSATRYGIMDLRYAAVPAPKKTLTRPPPNWRAC